MPNTAFNRIFNLRNASVKTSFRRAGDSARDAASWNEAVANYQAYLTLAPNDAKIHVQHGNCLKEAGRLDHALTAYDTAIGLDARDADAFLQRGHLLKIMGRRQEAVLAYGKSFELNQHGNPAFEEFVTLKQSGFMDSTAPLSGRVEIATLANLKIDQSSPPEGAVIYLDITDLMDYLRVNTSLSGIQRVLSNIILHSATFSETPNGMPVVPVLPDYNGSQIYAVRLTLLDGLLGMIAGGQSGRDELNSALDLVLASRAPVSLDPGDSLVIAGAFWIYQRYDLLNALRQNRVRISVFIHDLIQITDPEYVEPAATTVFRRSFVDILLVSSFILTNSHFVADEVRRYLTRHMNFQIPVNAIPLATELCTRKLDPRRVQREYTDLAREEYVLCVGTIEIRKNHMYLIKIWERMIAENRLHVPNLILVGKWGWEIQDLQKYLAESDYLGGRLFIYNGISDTDLAYFYEHCLFTIYPSFAEGWGLPVGESLSYGKPCIASGITAIPEVGGALCRYIDPFDVEDGFRVVTDTLADRADIAAWTKQVRGSFSAKSWRSFAFEFLHTVKDFTQNAELDDAGNNFLMETSQVAYFGHDMLVYSGTQPRRIAAARMARMTGWHGLEGWGCWAMRRRATLRFKTTLGEGQDANLYLYLKTPEGDELADCTVKSGAATTLIEDLRPVPRWCSAPVEIGKNGIVDVCLISGKGYYHRHGRELYLGILAIAITPANDQAARLKLLEEIVPLNTRPKPQIEYQPAPKMLKKEAAF